MKRLILAIIPLVLAACSTPAERHFADNPQQLGLYVALTNILSDTHVVVKNAQTGEVVELAVNHQLHDDTGYIVASLAPGRYTWYTYSPDGQTVVSLETPQGYFDVQANCFNYGGKYDFGTDGQGNPAFNDTTTLKDIEQLPWNIRRYARDRDVCSAAMGETNDRLAAADVEPLLAL